MSDVAQRTKAEAIAEAEQRGLVCIFPQRNELQIDLDSGVVNRDVINAINQNKDSEINIMARHLVTTSQNGNKHVYLRMTRKLGDLSRIALQAALGSDPVREALSVLRFELKAEAPTVLFELPENEAKVIRWRESFKDLLEEEE